MLLLYTYLHAKNFSYIFVADCTFYFDIQISNFSMYVVSLLTSVMSLQNK